MLKEPKLDRQNILEKQDPHIDKPSEQEGQERADCVYRGRPVILPAVCVQKPSRRREDSAYLNEEDGRGDHH